MYNKLRYIISRIRESLAVGNFSQLIHRQVFRNRIATPTEMDLSAIPLQINKDQDEDFTFKELMPSELMAVKWQTPNTSRKFKARQYFAKGWRCIAVMKDTYIAGDVWFLTYNDKLAKQLHPDLKMLGIHLEDMEAYAFDMLIHPSFRGKNLAMKLHRYLHQILQAEGFRKVYGYYWDDNLPALWMHRMLRFHELPKKKVSRIFFFIQSDDQNKNDSSYHNIHKTSPEKSTKDEV
jgi:GNAT superfamily N-acetyltransferase